MISVVVPVYNLKDLLPRCMDSLLHQTAGDYEIILTDDGSTDGGGQLCDRYAQDHPGRVRCIHKENGGLSSARNAGMDAARGEYVIFPDPDDRAEPDYLERLALLQEMYGADLVCTGYMVDYEDRSIPANPGQELRQMDRTQAREALLIAPCMGGFAWNKLYHLDIIRAHQLRFLDDVGTTEDLDFAFRYLAYCEKVSFAPEYRTYHYIQRSGAATHGGFTLQKLAAIRTYEKMLEAADASPDLEAAAREEICNTAINLLVPYLQDEDREEEIYRKLRAYIERYYADYMKSSRYGRGRKIQAVLARRLPKLYAKLKAYERDGIRIRRTGNEG